MKDLRDLEGLTIHDVQPVSAQRPISRGTPYKSARPKQPCSWRVFEQRVARYRQGICTRYRPKSGGSPYKSARPKQPGSRCRAKREHLKGFKLFRMEARTGFLVLAVLYVLIRSTADLLGSEEGSYLRLIDFFITQL